MKQIVNTDGEEIARVEDHVVVYGRHRIMAYLALDRLLFLKTGNALTPARFSDDGRLMLEP